MEVESRSVYRMVLRYTNPNAESFIGEVTVSPSGGYGGAAGDSAGAPADGGEGAAQGGEGAADGGAGAGVPPAGAGDTQTHQVSLLLLVVVI